MAVLLKKVSIHIDIEFAFSEVRCGYSEGRDHFIGFHVRPNLNLLDSDIQNAAVGKEVEKIAFDLAAELTGLKESDFYLLSKSWDPWLWVYSSRWIDEKKVKRNWKKMLK